MSDLIERLRGAATRSLNHAILREAADELEPLKAKCNQRRDDLKQARGILDERFREIKALQAELTQANADLKTLAEGNIKRWEDSCAMANELKQANAVVEAAREYAEGLDTDENCWDKIVTALAALETDDG